MAGDSTQGAGAGAGTDKETARDIARYSGEAFIVSTLHVSRDKKGGRPGEKEVKAIGGGRLVSDLEGDEKLKPDEVEEFKRAGAIRAALPDDIVAGRKRASEKEAAESARERREAFEDLDAEQAGERQTTISKHNTARDKELATLEEKHEKERAALEKKLSKSTDK